MRTGLISVMAVSLLTAACGSDTSQRAATGGLTGGGIGALAGGPIGAIIGAGVGGVAGWATPESADTMAMGLIRKEKQVAGGALNSAGMSENSVAYASANTQEIKRAQWELSREGLYHGHIDGIVGPQTKEAVSTYQGREGLKQTATLDRTTMDHLNKSIRTAQAQSDEQQEGSGSSQPPNQNATAEPAASRQ